MQMLRQELRYGVRMLAKSPVSQSVPCLRSPWGSARTPPSSASSTRLSCGRSRTGIRHSWSTSGADSRRKEFRRTGYRTRNVGNCSIAPTRSPGSAAYSLSGSARLTRPDAPPVRAPQPMPPRTCFRCSAASPFLGRNFNLEENQPSHSQFALLGYGLWRSEFGGDRNISRNRVDSTVRRTLSSAFYRGRFLSAAGKHLDSPRAGSRETGRSGSHYLHVVARLKPGVGPHKLRRR